MTYFWTVHHPVVSTNQRRMIVTRIAVTVAEASHVSGISRSSLYLLFQQGKLTPRKSGKRTLILIEDLERYLKSLPAAA